MRSIGGRSAKAVSSEGGGTLAAGSSFDPRSLHLPVLLVGAALAALLTLALSTLLAPVTPSTPPAGARDRAHGKPTVGLSIGLAAAASTAVGVAEHGFWLV